MNWADQQYSLQQYETRVIGEWKVVAANQWVTDGRFKFEYKQSFDVPLNNLTEHIFHYLFGSCDAWVS